MDLGAGLWWIAAFTGAAVVCLGISWGVQSDYSEASRATKVWTTVMFFIFLISGAMAVGQQVQKDSHKTCGDYSTYDYQNGNVPQKCDPELKRVEKDDN